MNQINDFLVFSGSQMDPVSIDLVQRLRKLKGVLDGINNDLKKVDNYLAINDETTHQEIEDYYMNLKYSYNEKRTLLDASIDEIINILTNGIFVINGKLKMSQEIFEITGDQTELKFKVWYNGNEVTDGDLTLMGRNSDSIYYPTYVDGEWTISIDTSTKPSYVFYLEHEQLTIETYTLTFNNPNYTFEPAFITVKSNQTSVDDLTFKAYSDDEEVTETKFKLYLCNQVLECIYDPDEELYIIESVSGAFVPPMSNDVIEVDDDSERAFDYDPEGRAYYKRNDLSNLLTVAWESDITVEGRHFTERLKGFSTGNFVKNLTFKNCVFDDARSAFAFQRLLTSIKFIRCKIANNDAAYMFEGEVSLSLSDQIRTFVSRFSNVMNIISTVTSVIGTVLSFIPVTAAVGAGLSVLSEIADKASTISNFVAEAIPYGKDKYHTYMQEIDLSGLDTSNVTRMEGMFKNLIYLKKIAFYKKNENGSISSSFNTNKVEYMYDMFLNCHWLGDNGNIQGQEDKIVDFTFLSFGRCLSFQNMFNGCSHLRRIKWASGFRSDGKPTRMDYMFANCLLLDSIDLRMNMTANVSTTEGMFQNDANLKTIGAMKFSNALTNTCMMFQNCASLGCTSGKQYLDMSEIDVSNAEYIYRMFEGCSALMAIKINFNTSNAKYMDCLFKDCSMLRRIMSKQDFVYKRNKMHTGHMFENCFHILGGKTTRYVETNSDQRQYILSPPDYPILNSPLGNQVNNQAYFYMKKYFKKNNDISTMMARQDNGESAPGYFSPFDFDLNKDPIFNVQLTYSYFSNADYWNELNNNTASSVTIREKIFYEAVNTMNITSNVKIITFENCLFMNPVRFFISTKENEYIFKNCIMIGSAEEMFAYNPNLNKVTFISCDTEFISVCKSMFQGCSNITEIDLSGFNTCYIKNFQNMFMNCYKLQTIYVNNFSDLSDMSDESLDGTNMFYSCVVLRGPQATYHAEYSGKQMAQWLTGYFTLKTL